MDILLIGGFFDSDYEKIILENSKSIVHYAANNFQKNLIDGFFELKDIVNLEILSAPFVGSFPRDFNKMFLKMHKSLYRNKVVINYVKFNNIWGFKNISRKNNLISKVKSFSKLKSESKLIIVYSTHTPFLQAAVHAKKLDPKIHICLIVPDLPQFMNLNSKKTMIYNILKKYDIKIFNDCTNDVDSFVLLTEPMKDILKVGDRPYIVIEGIVNRNQISHKALQDSELKSVVYTGTLNKKFGILNLIEAFIEIKRKDVELNICGTGDSLEIVKEYAKKDKGIKIHGQISNDASVKLQENATVLVNPRQNNEEFTKYSFPSKNMEYLLSGIPTIAYKLDGIPDEYDNYIIYVKDNSIYSLSNTIKEILDKKFEQRKEIGELSRKFVLDKKNNVKACERIISMYKESQGTRNV